MQKYKTKKIFIVLIGALLSTIFAFTIGFTYANINLHQIYGTNVNSAKAYMGNNQYVVNNDTKKSPVAYAVGSHSTEITLEYAIDYEFDLRIKYSLDWIGDEQIVQDTGKQLSTDNVKLMFANRDNVIVDNQYIYFINYKEELVEVGGEETTVKSACGLPAGDGKISLVSGVEIIETHNKDYKGKSLEIKIDEVKIIKTNLEDYSSSSHPLYNSGEAGKAWQKHKTSSDLGNQAYVMVYNHRYIVDNGISYPGHTSTYSKLGDDSITGNWLGGNRAYAGVGLYIITGDSPIKLSAKVVGTWQDNDNSQTAGLQFDNSISFNYGAGWKHLSYDSNKLFETRYYEKQIPANTACYIEVVESVEITCAHNVAHNDFDAYSLVVYEMYVNGVTFKDASITSALISTSSEEFETTGDYSSSNVAVVNAGKYANNIYEFQLGSKALQEYSNSSITLINNTAVEKQVKVKYSCNYYISNGAHLLVLASTGERATSFTETAYFRASGVIGSDYCSVPTATNYVIAPYSSIDINTDFSVNGNFQEYVLTGNYNKHDAWVELNASIEEVDVELNSNMAVEVDIVDTTATVRVKNNTNKIINSISGTINVYNFKLALGESTEPSKPNDWDATFWRYYTISDGEPVQNQSKIWVADTFRKGFYSASKIQLYNMDGSADANNGAVSRTGLTLKPNESVEIFKFTIDAKSEIINESFVTGAGSQATGVQIVKENVSTAYLTNYDSVSYFVKLTGSGNESAINNTVAVGNKIYYTRVIRPGEILEIPSTITEVQTISAEDDYVAGSNGTLSAWDNEIINIFDLYFT